MTTARSVARVASWFRLCTVHPRQHTGKTRSSPLPGRLRPGHKGRRLWYTGQSPAVVVSPHGTVQQVFRKEAAGAPLRAASSRRVHAHSSGQQEALPGETACTLGLVS